MKRPVSSLEDGEGRLLRGWHWLGSDRKSCLVVSCFSNPGGCSCKAVHSVPYGYCTYIPDRIMLHIWHCKKVLFTPYLGADCTAEWHGMVWHGIA